MAGWKESVGRFAQSAVSKSKEVAEITRLNMEISNQEQRLRELHNQLGQFLVEHAELVPVDAADAQALLQEVAQVKAGIENSKATLLEVRNVNICPGCGAEVARTSKFCPSCGAQMDRSVMERLAQTPVCPNCGAELEAGAAFCGNCGSKL